MKENELILKVYYFELVIVYGDFYKLRGKIKFEGCSVKDENRNFVESPVTLNLHQARPKPELFAYCPALWQGSTLSDYNSIPSSILLLPHPETLFN